MHYRRLGASGLQLSALSFGAWVTFGNQIARDEARNLVAAAWDNGVNFFDNAEVYAHGRAEQVMGDVIADLRLPRDGYCVSSKVFFGAVENPDLISACADAFGSQAVVEAVTKLAAGELRGEVQDDSLATYAHKLNKDEARLDWSRPAVELERLVRAFNPWPICHSTLNGEALKIHAAQLGEGQGTPGSVLAADKSGLTVACGEGALRLTRLQLPGGKPLSFADLYNSRREQFAPSLVLGQ